MRIIFGGSIFDETMQHLKKASFIPNYPYVSPETAWHRRRFPLYLFVLATDNTTARNTYNKCNTLHAKPPLSGDICEDIYVRLLETLDEDIKPRGAQID